MSSGPGLYMKVDGSLQGAELESGAGKTHKVEVFAWPADGEKKLSRVQLLGRGGKVLAEKRDFSGGCITWNVAADAEGGYLVARAFGENDADFAEKRQQLVKHCALTNPVWLRTDAFRAPKPIPAPDPLTIREIRELEDFLLKGEFRFDPVNKPGVSNLLNIYSAFSGVSVEEILAGQSWRGYGDLKKELVAVTQEALAPIKKNYEEIRHSEELIRVLNDGAERASAIAAPVMQRVRDKFGLGLG